MVNEEKVLNLEDALERIRKLEDLASEHGLGILHIDAEPMKPVHVHEEYPEHDWELDEKGRVDEFVLDLDYHNGPMCKRCGWSFCEHCNPEGWKTPCVVDRYECPVCGQVQYANHKHCPKCGQALDWNG